MDQAAKCAAEGGQYSWKISGTSIQEPAIERGYQQDSSRSDDAKIANLGLRNSLTSYFKNRTGVVISALK